MSEKAVKFAGPQVVFSMYKPNEGKEAELRKLIERHIPTLRRLELITDREVILVRSSNGTYIEIFEWRSSDSASKAHQHPELAAVWEGMGAIATFPALESLAEAKGRFPHFQPVSL